jgi:hypothetical protein
MKKTTTDWLNKIAAKNGVTKEDVLKYVKSLSSSAKVIHHLSLA